jgi:protein TonB
MRNLATIPTMSPKTIHPRIANMALPPEHAGCTTRSTFARVSSEGYLMADSEKAVSKFSDPDGPALTTNIPERRGDMPKNMFQDVVRPHGDSTRKWYALPLSFTIHTAVLIALVVVPLMAVDALPTPRTMMAFMTPVVPPAPPAPAPPRKALVSHAVTEPPSGAAPVAIPSGIQPETGLIVEPADVGAEIEGVVEGFGSPLTAEPPPPPAPAPAPPKPIRLSGGLTPPSKIRDAAPQYPVIALSARVQGDVIIEATIGADGKVKDARVLRSVPLLDEAAIAAVRSWEYTPTMVSGQPVPIIMTVTVRFRLQ